MVIIRYLSTEIRMFAYMKNLPLIASFFGIGLGMIWKNIPPIYRRMFPFVAFLLFFQIAFAPQLHLTHTPFPSPDNYIWGENLWEGTASAVKFIAVLFEVSILTVLFFVVIGGIVGECLSQHAPLCGYGTNLIGSLMGIVVFTLLAFLNLPPSVWMLFGFLLLLPFYYEQKMAIAVFALLVATTSYWHSPGFWSPYYRIDLAESPRPAPGAVPSAYELSVNHDYHQRIVDLSPEFFSRFPTAEPNRSALSTYEFPYRLVDNPGEVLIVGAGTGNDVAAALRHGATHVDAVEIDPVILRLGKLYHPERPYDSTKVTSHIDDARAFFKKTKNRYDLIVFGYLDAHTLLSSLSSIRLDNFVYTLESFREARTLLKEDGTLVLAFAGGKSFVSKRIFDTLESTFGISPHVYFTGYDASGAVFVEGGARRKEPLPEFPEKSGELRGMDGDLIATDNWPFLYLSSRTIPLSNLMVFVLFLSFSLIVARHTMPARNTMTRLHMHFFLLGAGFLLLETKGVTEISLLFGSTWITNSIVIGAFLFMSILANLVINYRSVPYGIPYIGLFLLLCLSLLFPFSLLDALPTGAKIIAAGSLVGFPVFFTGLIFSQSFKPVTDPTQALGVNLFGAVFGGIMENSVMIGGMVTVGILAILIYLLSAISLPVAGGK
jgi:SAM-dependent methyltransferase